MDWESLLSGLIGAVIGGVLTLVAAILTTRQQRQLALDASTEERRQARLTASRGAGLEILREMLVVKRGLEGLASANPSKSPEAVAARDALERIFVTHCGLLHDGELRRRVDGLVPAVDEYWATEGGKDNETSLAAQTRVMEYMEFVHRSIRAHFDGEPLPETMDPPRLEESERAGS